MCGTEFEKSDVPKEYLYNHNLCSRGCNKKNQREYYEERKNSGKCPKCGEPVLEDSIYCQECLEKVKEKMKEKYERYKREGKCPTCGYELPTDGRNWDGVYCPECQEKYRNDKFYGEYATDAEIRNGLHTDMVENKLDLED